MAAIYKKIEIDWCGKKYSVTPNFNLIMTIEQRVSVAGLLGKLLAKDAPFSHVAYVLSCCLAEAGCPANPDDIYEKLWETESSALQSAVFQILFEMMPKTKAGGDPQGNMGVPAKEASFERQ